MFGLVPAWFRGGLLKQRQVRARARHLMNDEAVRPRWEHFAHLRETEARSRKDRAVNAIVTDGHTAATA